MASRVVGRARAFAEVMEERILHSADLSPLQFAPLAAAQHGSHLESVLTQSTASTAQLETSEIVFIDAELSGIDSILLDLQTQRQAGRSVDIVLVGADVDGIALISSTLASRSGIAAVHLLAHGGDGELQLGRTRLDAASLLQRAGEIAGWGDSLGADADLLLYGCDVAGSALGRAFALELAQLTGADVAASTDLTGAAALGGNWTLEYESGAIDAAGIAGSLAQQAFGGVLATFVADPSAIDGAIGSLRWAIDQANALADLDTIQLLAGTHNLTLVNAGGSESFNVSGDLDIRNNVILVGGSADPAATVIRSTVGDRVIDVVIGSATLRNLTLTGGDAMQGGSLSTSNATTATLTDVVISGNSGTNGGAVYSFGALTMERVRVTGNTSTATGGGVTVRSTTSMTDVEISGNTAATDGGGLYLQSAASNVTLNRVTISGNQAGTGAGIFAGNGSVTATNTTISGNTATGLGGGTYFSTGSFSFTDSTIAGNAGSSGGGFGGPMAATLKNTIVASNTGGNAAVRQTSAGWNIDTDGTAITAAGTDRVVTPAALKLGPLFAYGGYTQTHGLLSGSVAIDTGNPSASTTDQRGNARTGTPDVGAAEADGKFYVTTTADVVDGTTTSISALLGNMGADGRISLREAIIAANNTVGADEITLPAGNYVLSRTGNDNLAAVGDLDITDALTIIGAGARTTTINANSIDRVFDVRAAAATLTGVTVQGGSSVADGGAFLVSGNAAALTLRDSAISGNTAAGSGGAIGLIGTLVLDRVTIDGNSSTGGGANGGGGLDIAAGSVATLTNVTLTGNTATRAGGAILSRGDVTIVNSTIAGNSGASGGGIDVGGGSVSLLNTILANNTGGNAAGSITSLGHNIDSANTAGLTGTGDRINTNPLLGALQYNAGGLRTMAIGAGSAAIDGGTASGAPALDARGVFRITHDIGAYERNSLIVDTTSDVVDGSTSSIDALLGNKGADGRISLREAVIASNNTAGVDDISLPTGTYALSIGGADEDLAASGDLDVRDGVRIAGAGAASTVVSGGGTLAVMQFVSGSSTLSGMSVASGYSKAGAGGIQVNAGATLAINQSVVRDNRNDDNGSGIANAGNLTLTDVEVRANTSSKDGGGMLNTGGTLTLNRVTLAGNSAVKGGGLQMLGGVASLTNVTVSHNVGSNKSGGLGIFGGTASLLNVTIADNQSASVGGLDHSSLPAGAITLRNVLFAGNQNGNIGGDDIDSSTVSSLGNNLSTTFSPELSAASDRRSAVATLGTLGDWGGFTRTRPLLAGSAAINNGDTAAAPTTDQRNIARVGNADIGAFEFGGAANSAPVLDASKSPVLAAVPANAGAPVGAVGTLVSALVDAAVPAGELDNVSDADAGALLGIAVIGVDAVNGSGWWSIDNGTNWTAFSGESPNAARLLAADSQTRVYFQPNPGFTGSIAATLTIRAWDRSVGANGGTGDSTVNGGATAYSVATDSVGQVVAAAPVVTTSGGALAYVENDGPRLIDAGIVVSDADSLTLAGATVRISANHAGAEDVLGFTDQLGISGSFDAATGVLTLGGSASVADYQTALGSVTYANTSDNPSTLGRTIAFSVDDGSIASAAAGRTVTVSAVNDPPVVTTTPGTLVYTENDPATLIDAGLVLGEAEATLASATVAISGNYANGQDSLLFVAQSGITGSWNAASGVLSLSGSASVAAWQAALRSVAYVNSSETPSTVVRTITYVVNDGTVNSPAATRDLSVAAVDDAPTVGTSAGTVAYTENDLATAVDAGITLGDVDSATLASATITISANYASNQDRLAFTSQGGIGGSFNVGTGVLALSGVASLADYQAVLRSVTYENLSDAPSGAVRTIGFRVDDGTSSSAVATRTLSVTAVVDHLLTVDTTNDVSDGVTTSVDALLANRGADGRISLREAIAAANNTAGLDTIRFNFADSDARHYYYRDNGVAGSLSTVATTVLADAAITDFDPDHPYGAHSWFRIDLNTASAELGITSPLVIDGYSQAGAAANTLAVGSNARIRVELTNTGADNNRGLVLLDGSDGSTIKGLAINRFSWTGIMIDAGADGNTITGNFIGTDITGTLALGNGDDGLQVRTSNNVIGGADPAARNLMAGNASRGINFFTAAGTANNNAVTNNYIGIDATGTRAIANTVGGIQANNLSNSSITGNVISGNSGYGIWFRTATSTGNTVQANLIGTSAAGTAAIANTGDGILLDGNANSNRIGGTAAGTGNTIANNGGRGVSVVAATGVSILGNSIFGNAGGLGIDLLGNGVTVNDAGDGDSGPNGLQNFPVLSSAAVDGANTTVTGTLNSNASTAFRIEFFSSPSGDASGYGEGRTWLGSTTVPTNASGNASFSALLSGVAVTPGHAVSATATVDLGGGNHGSTSEFSANRAATVAPVVVASGGSLAYTEAQPALAIDPGLVVADADSTNLTGATVSISANFASGQDVLSFTNQLGITGSWNAAAGVLTLSGTTTVANYQAALRTVGYANSSSSPSTLTRAVSFVVNDGVVASGGAVKQISVAPLNSMPLIAVQDTYITSGSAINQGQSTSLVVDHGGGGIGNVRALLQFDLNAIPSGATIVSATLLMQATVNASPFLVEVYRVTEAWVEGSGGTSAANWDERLPGTPWTALDGASRDLTPAATLSSLPPAGVAQHSWDLTSLVQSWRSGSLANHGIVLGGTAGGSNTTTYDSSEGTTPPRLVVKYQQTPVVTTSGGSLGYVENDLPKPVDAGLVLTESAALSGASIAISANHAAAQDVLAFSDQLGISGSWNAATGVLTLSGAASQADYQTALRSITYANTSENPSTLARTVSITVRNGSMVSAVATRSVNVAAVNDAPVLTTSSGTVAYTENDAAVVVDAALTVADADAAVLTNASVSIAVNHRADQDMLLFTNQAGITGSWDAATGVLSLNGSASVADYQAALRTVRYVNTSEAPSASPRTISFVASDGALASTAGSRTVSVAAVNDAPQVTTGAGTLAYTENAGTVAIDADLTISDADHVSLVGATVRITANHAAAQDRLVFTDQSGISGVFDAATGVLTLGGSASLTDYQTALRSVAYVNDSDAPSTLTRTISFTAGDGSTSSTVATRMVSVAAVNDAPVVATPAGQSTLVNNAVVFSSANGNALTLTDADAAAAPVQLMLSVTNGTLTLGTLAGLTFSTGDGTADATIRFTGTLGAINAALDGLRFDPTANVTGTAVLTIDASDLGNSGSGGALVDSETVLIEVLSSNTAPALSGANAFATIAEDATGNNGTLVSALIATRVTDPDAGALSGIAVTAVDDSNGQWQYSSNGGSSWTAFGTPTPALARLLAADANTRVRFVPTAHWNGSVANGISFRAWDQRSGTAGGNADTTQASPVVRDEFTSTSYANNDSVSASWSGSWTDSDGSASAGQISIGSGRMNFAGSLLSSSSVQRQVNLAGATGATLSFDFSSSLGLSTLTLEVSRNGGASWTTLRNSWPGGSGSAIEDLGGYLSATTRIRFSISGVLGGGNFSVDNLQIAWTKPLNAGSTAFSSATASSGITVTPVNDAPVGVPTISGSATENQTLSANTSGLSDADGLGALGFQWLRNGMAVSGANGSTLLLGDADVGSAISVRVNWTDAQGSAESVTSAATAAVANINDMPTGSPVITGSASENATLGIDTSGIADIDGLGAFSLQWLRDGVAIGGATGSTLLLGDADVGKAISVRVNWTDAQGTAESLTSAPTAPVANVNDAPAGAPTTSGFALENQTLTAATGTIADADGLGVFGYQWLRDGVAITGATASTLVLGDADVGRAISVRVGWTDGHGTVESLTSAATAAVININDTPTGAPLVTGSVTEDQTLGVDTSGIGDADGLGAFSHQWLRDGVAITGATASTLTLGDADVGARISVRTAWTDGGGRAESLTSAQTAPVANVNDAPTGAPLVTGSATENATLGVDTSAIADIDGLGAFGYQWLRNGVAVAGATGSTLLLGDADVGTRLSVRVNWTDGHGTTESVTSAQTAPVANVNDAPTGLPVITGSVSEDATLGIDTSAIADFDGLGAFSHQWLRDGVAISGATASTLTLGDADVGRRISVRVSWTDGNGTAEAVTSAQTDLVANVNDAPTGRPTITGSATEDATLVVATGAIADVDGLGAFSVQWLRDGVAIGGATGTSLLLGDADVGRRISVRVGWTDGYGMAETVTSLQTATVANVNDAPTGLPLVTGSAVENATLGVDTATLADIDGLGAFSHQWLRNGTAISGATASTLLLGDADVGQAISVRVSWTDLQGTAESRTSAATAAVVNVNDVPTGVPTISGSAAEYQTLTALTSGIADADGLGAFRHQWLRDGVAIGGATGSSLVLGAADIGKRISVRVDWTDGWGGDESVTSAQTAPVANTNDVPIGVPVITGSPIEDATLSVDGTAIADNDGLGAFSVQWLRNGTAIAGATGTTLQLGDADVGRRISVRIGYTDGYGTSESVTSAQTAPVGNVNDAPTGTPLITGSAIEDRTLGVNLASIADIDGLGTFAYQWLRDGTAISGATGSTLLLGDADVGRAISMRVSWTDARGTAEALTSAATAPILNINDAPRGSNTTLTVERNGARALQRSDFGFADTGGESNAFASVLMQLPSAGSLRLDGSLITVPTEVSVAQLDAGALVYAPVFGGSGSGYATIGFQVRDAGGTDNAGVDLDPVRRTLGFDIVNRAPVISSHAGAASVARVVAENTSAVTSVAATDADGDVPVYSIVGGADAARFKVDSASGLVSFVVPPNFEAPLDIGADNVYQVIVRASDGVQTADQSLSVTVGNAVEAVHNTLELPVNGVTTDLQETSMINRGSTHAVAMAPNGEHLVVWSSRNQDGSGWGVYAQRFDRAGTSLGNAVLVNQATAGDQLWASVAMDVGGRAVVTWTSSNQDGTPYSVYARRFDVDGTAAGDEFRVHSTGSGNQYNSSVAIDANGNFIIVWQGNGPNDNDGIFGRRFRADGSAIDGIEFRVNTDTSRAHHDVGVAMNASGAFAVSWDNADGVQMRRYDSAGAPLGGQVNVTDDPTAGNGSIALADDGSVVVVWRETQQGRAVLMQRYNASGAAVGGNTVVNSTFSSDQTDPSIAVDGRGNFIIAWEGNGVGDSSGVFAQKYSAGGTRVGGEFRINTTTSGTQGKVSLAMLDLDNLVAVWSGQGASDAEGVFMRQYGTLNSPPVLLASNGLPTIAEDAQSNPGTLVSNLIAGQSSDVDDPAALGIAVIAADNRNGDWQFSIDGGSTWAAFGAVDGSSARLLAADALSRVRFVPAPHWNGSVEAGLLFRGWDLSSGAAGATSDASQHGGITAFSSNTAGAGITVTPVNDAPVGLPLIVGSAVEDNTLVAGLDGITDADGLGSFTLQWLRNGVAINGATGASLRLGDADVGKAIRLRVSYVDNQGNAEVLTSAATATVGNVNDAPVGLPVIGGDATEDNTLSADLSGISDTDGLGGFGLQWQRDGVAIGGATGNSLKLGDADVGRTISLRVVYVDGYGTVEALVSASTSAVVNVNDAPSGRPVVVGTAREDHTLTADLSSITDADGLGPFNLQWLRDGVAIDGATTSSLTLGNADVGRVISLRVDYVDARGTAEQLTSVMSAPVGNVNDEPTGLPLIVGAAIEDRVLSADLSGIADADGLGVFSLQWLRNGVAVNGATGSSLTLGDADVGQTITLQVSYVDGWGAAQNLSSAATVPVVNVNDLPVGLPRISGAAIENRVLVADLGSISDADGLGSFSLQWLRNGVTISGATGNSLRLGDADVGATIRLRVSYVDAQGTAETLTSAATAPVVNVNDVPIGLPVIVGSAVEDQTLAVDRSAISDADGLGPFELQWLRNGQAIAGATGETLRLGDADVGAAISVRVSYVDGNGTAESLTSAASAKVVDVNDAPTGRPVVVGLAIENQTLTADLSAIDDADGLGSFSLQWLRNGSAIADATGASLVLGELDGSQQISLRVNYVDGHGNAEVIDSAPTAPVLAINDTPQLNNPIGDRRAIVGSNLNLAIPPATFSDDDIGDTLSWSIAGVDGAELPDWLIFDASTGVFSGTPARGDLGTFPIRLTATDRAGASAFDDFTIEVVLTNIGPVHAAPLANQAASQGVAFEYVVPADSFSDPDIGDVLSLRATLVSGQPLPQWLVFDPATQRFSGTPANDDVGSLQIRVTASDLAGVSVAGEFALQVANVNDAPSAIAMADRLVEQDQPFALDVAALFFDIDVGDRLRLDVPLADGGPLPAWLVFDADTGRLSGTPGNADVDSLAIRLGATDLQGVSTAIDFTLTVGNVNDAPRLTAPLDNRRATDGVPFSATIPADRFVEIDAGDRMNFSATLVSGAALPDWLAFDAESLTFSGTPSNDDVTTLMVQVSATDGAGASVSGSFRLTVDNRNDTPTLVAPLPDLQATQDRLLSWTVPAGSFDDIDVDDILSYSASLVSGAAWPGWLTFDPVSKTLSGTPGNADVGDLQIRITATDIDGAKASGDLVLRVLNLNDAPRQAGPLDDRRAADGVAFNAGIAADRFFDIDVGDRLVVSASLASGAALPAWLVFDADTLSFSGTPANADVGTLLVRITATDVAGASVSGDFTLTVDNRNDAPTLVAALPALQATQGQLLNWTVPAGSFDDIDVGDTLSYRASLVSGAALPGWLTFDPVSKTLSGTPGNADVGDLQIRITATDIDGAKASGDLVLRVLNLNDAPRQAGPLDDRRAADGVAFNAGIAAGRFFDIDVGDRLVVSASLASGAALPAWLVFDADTLSFSGTPANADVGTLSVRITATDVAGASVSGDFTLTVDNRNDAPTLVAALPALQATQGQLLSWTVPAGSFDDIDVGDTLSYRASLVSGAALPAWLAFDPVSRSLLGTPGNADVGQLAIRITATDTDGASAFADLMVRVLDVNDAPQLSGADDLAPVLESEFANRGTRVADLIAGFVTDVDSGAVAGVALVAADTSHGRWQYTTDGNNWFDLGAVGEQSARLLAADASSAVRFVPVDRFRGALSGVLTLRAWDQTSGTAGQLADATAPGGQSAFSSELARVGIVVTAVNHAPELVLPLDNRSIAENQQFEWKLPPAGFVDSDAGDTLSYSASLASGAPLPAWLTFDPATLTFKGSPPAADIGSMTIRVTATDLAGATAQGVFAVRVSALPPVLVVESAKPPVAAAPEESAAEPEAAAPEAATDGALVDADAAPTGAGVATADSVLASLSSVVVQTQSAFFRTELVESTRASRDDAVLAVLPAAQFNNLVVSSPAHWLHNQDMLRKFDDLKHQMQDLSQQQQQFIASSLVISSGMSIGYVVWLVRGGVLVSSMLSALPAWQMIDPLPVLAASGAIKGKGLKGWWRKGGEAEEHAVEQLFDARRQSGMPSAVVSSAAHTHAPVGEATAPGTRS